MKLRCLLQKCQGSIRVWRGSEENYREAVRFPDGLQEKLHSFLEFLGVLDFAFSVSWASCFALGGRARDCHDVFGSRGWYRLGGLRDASSIHSCVRRGILIHNVHRLSLTKRLRWNMMERGELRGLYSFNHFGVVGETACAL